MEIIFRNSYKVTFDFGEDKKYSYLTSDALIKRKKLIQTTYVSNYLIYKLENVYDSYADEWRLKLPVCGNAEMVYRRVNNEGVKIFSDILGVLISLPYTKYVLENGFFRQENFIGTAKSISTREANLSTSISALLGHLTKKPVFAVKREDDVKGTVLTFLSKTS
jgi:hypothetical protein